jgi:hypothetical protein
LGHNRGGPPAEAWPGPPRNLKRSLTLLDWLDRLSLGAIAIPAAFLGLAPFYPEPHLWEKLKMLAAGTLVRPIDIFDLFLHGVPVALLLLKLARARGQGGTSG